MPLTVRCPSCSTQHQVQDQLRGKSARCRCGQVLQIPAGTPGQAGPAQRQPAAAAGMLAVQCPQCRKSHQAPTSMAGQAVRCGCGAAFRVPAAGPASADAVAVQCPGCGKQHQAPRSLAGQMVRCGCGASFQVPGGQSAANPFSDQAADPFGLGGGNPLAGGAAGDPLGGAWDDFGGPAAGSYGAPGGGAFPGTPANWNAAQAYAAPSQAASKGKSKGKSSNKRPGRCPKCGSGNYKTPVFTWWGGLVGQHLISHVICQKCYTAFNSKTGGSNTPLIVGYHVVILVIVLVCAILGAVAGN